jgi:two-component system sensor histidine kinase YcbA
MILIPLAGELNFYPFNDSFRVSFGMPTFFFFLLISHKKIPAFLSGILAGIAVVAFRISLDLFHGDLLNAFTIHYPTFFYYFTFGCLFYITRAKRFIQRSILIGLLGISFDILASLGELTFQYVAFNSMITYEGIQKISIIAIFRSFSTVGLLILLILYKTQLEQAEIQKQNDQLTLVISSLYEESTNLQKTLVNSESITKDAYHLYTKLLNVENNSALSQMALKIAGETHEIKKDNQRILSGLSRLITDKSFSEYMEINKIIDLAVASNHKYVRSLKKDIKIISHTQGEHPPYHVYQTLSMINNLLANAIEAMDHAGKIYISVHRADDEVEFQITDDGPGIPNNQMHLVFKPGFTNKYDHAGSSFTGIGLTYVKELVESLEGEISINSKAGDISGTSFKIRLPIKNIKGKG